MSHTENASAIQWQKNCLCDEATTYLDSGYQLLSDFVARWFDDLEPSDSTIFDITHRYELLQAHLNAIIDTFAEAKTRLYAAQGEADSIYKGMKCTITEMETVINYKRGIYLTKKVKK